MLINKKDSHQETRNVQKSLKDRKQIGLKLKPIYTQDITPGSQTIERSSWRGSRITLGVTNWATVSNKIPRKRDDTDDRGKRIKK